MNKKLMMLIGMLMLVSISINAVAQSRNKKISTNNERWYAPVGVAISSGSVAPFAGVGYEKNIASGSHFRLGMEATFSYSKTCLPAVDVIVSYRAGKKFYIEPALIGGVGSIGNYIVAENDLFTYKRTTVYLLPEVGGRLSLGLNTNRFALALFAAYKWQFGAKQQTTPAVDGMEVVEAERFAPSLQLGMVLGYNISNTYRNCGDHVWRAGLSYGYNVLGGEQKVSAELSKFDRFSYHFGHVYGVEMGQTLGEIEKTSALLKYGMQFLPRGEASWLIPELSIKAGMGEAINQTSLSGEAENGEFSSRSRILQPAAEIGAELKLGFHLGGWTLFVAGEYVHDFPLGTEVGGDGVSSHATNFEHCNALYIKGGVMFTF